MKTITDKEMEKRESIRIKDRILLGFREITEDTYRQRLDEYMAGLKDPWIESTHPTVRKGIRKHLKRLKDKDPDLAAVLEVLDEKLNILMGHLGGDEASGANHHQTRLCKVDLSAKGVAFTSERAFEPGTILDLHIGLLPEHYFFNCFGRVVRKDEKNGNHFLAIKFIWITEDDQEKLIEHIFGRQVLQLRMRRKKKEQEKEG